ncbi:MAG: acyl-CoA dehydrogenase family protein [Chloroflexi bacterium]|nr:acyl-CoA dehydrogenase family protein [Chloroflexota bacterium]
MDLTLTPEQRAIQEAVRAFVERRIKPIALQQDRLADPQERFPWAIIEEASRLGLRSLALSTERGGGGADTLTGCIVTEELAVGDVGIAATLAQTSFLAHRWFDGIMSDTQRDLFLPPFLADDLSHLALAGHEPDFDLGWSYYNPPLPGSGHKTTAVQDERGRWVINGNKVFITNGTVAKLFAVQARTETLPDGRARISTFFVPRDTPGLTLREHDKMGRRLGSNGALVFEDCRIPADYQLLGTGGSPLEGAASAIGRSPVYSQAWALGIGRAAYEAALQFTRERVQGGKPIVQHQAVGLVLAEMSTQLAAARAILWQAAWGADHLDAYDEGHLPEAPLAAMARLFVSEAVLKVATAALQLFGGMGIMNELPMQKLLRDAVVVQHGNFGTNDTARLRIAEILAGYRRSG